MQLEESEANLYLRRRERWRVGAVERSDSTSLLEQCLLGCVGLCYQRRQRTMEPACERQTHLACRSTHFGHLFIERHLLLLMLPNAEC